MDPRDGQLGIFDGERLIQAVPCGPGGRVEAYELRRAIADERGCEPAWFQVLIICPNHPTRSRVDCMDCPY